MKKFSLSVLSIFILSILIVFQNCGEKDKETDKERALRILQSKTWTVSSVNVPLNTATESADWVDFTVSFTASSTTTAQHPTGAQAVWPSGAYEVSDNGNLVTRSIDNVVMTFNPIDDTNFTARFTVPAGTEIGSGRIASLEGEYTFNMK